MRLLTSLTFLVISFVVIESATSYLGTNSIAFLNTLLGKLTKPSFFKSSDQIVQNIANDVGYCAGNTSTIDQMTAALSDKVSSYQTTLCTTKASMGNYLLTFIDCVQNKCKDGTWTSWLAGTLGYALKANLNGFYAKCTAPVPKMISNGWTMNARVENLSLCASGELTDKLVRQIVNATMKRSCNCTWIQCVRPVIVAGVLNISQYVTTTNLLMPNCPSKLANQTS